jgi:hypothetical protein
MFHKLRPVDQLRHLLVSNVGGDGEEIERFFKLHQVIPYFYCDDILNNETVGIRVKFHVLGLKYYNKQVIFLVFLSFFT